MTEGDLYLLRDDLELPATPIVILAGCPYEPELAGMMADSIRGWLIKPVAAADLSRTVRRVLTTQAVGAASGGSIWFG